MSLWDKLIKCVSVATEIVGDEYSKFGFGGGRARKFEQFILHGVYHISNLKHWKEKGRMSISNSNTVSYNLLGLVIITKPVCSISGI